MIPSNSLTVIEKFSIKKEKEGFLGGDLKPDGKYDVYKEIIDPDYKLSDNLTKEANRLKVKRDIINPLYFTKQRNDAFLKSDTARRNAYWRMGMIVLFTFIICFTLVILKTFFPIIPSFLFDLLFIVLFSGSIIYVFFMWISIQQRDPMDFDKLKLPAPKDKGNVMVQKAKLQDYSGDLGVLTDMYNMNFGEACIGNSCCANGTSYNIDNNRCEGFTSLGPFSTKFPETFTVYSR